ncbi:MAG TPA: hypothetical protein VN745_08135 [Verrucomicrobiae bacterium]|nr:hypothetical protein [Verrucomicrobiae bacterium]
MAWDKLVGRSAPGAKSAAPEKADAAASTAEQNSSEATRRNRRSKRVFISMRVRVKFQHGSQSHEEETLTETVNGHGCLLRLKIAPERGQTLEIMNTKSGATSECRAAYVGHSEGGKTKVGVEFTAPAENFWHIAFPPDDWNATDFSDSPILQGRTPQSSRRV